MTFEQLGFFGKFIGILVVLASLVYIARKIRQSRTLDRDYKVESTALPDDSVEHLCIVVETESGAQIALAIFRFDEVAARQLRQPTGCLGCVWPESIEKHDA